MAELTYTRREVLDKKRRDLMKLDIEILRNEDYAFTFDFDTLIIKVKGILFDYQKLHCLYINSHEANYILLEY